MNEALRRARDTLQAMLNHQTVTTDAWQQAIGTALTALEGQAPEPTYCTLSAGCRRFDGHTGNCDSAAAPTQQAPEPVAQEPQIPREPTEAMIAALTGGQDVFSRQTIREAPHVWRVMHDAARHQPAPAQCGICGAFIKPGAKGKCSHCGSEWDNGESAGMDAARAKAIEDCCDAVMKSNWLNATYRRQIVTDIRDRLATKESR
jgi:hypothetical protein